MSKKRKLTLDENENKKLYKKDEVSQKVFDGELMDLDDKVDEYDVYEDNFLNYFQIEEETLRKNYDIVKNSKIRELDKKSIKYLKYMETFNYTEANDSLPTPYIFIWMHSSLNVFYDDILEEPYYETLPSPINMWRLKLATQFTSCSIKSVSGDVLKIDVPDEQSDKKINDYLKYIISIYEFKESKTKLMFDISQRYIESERTRIVNTKQREFYINKIYKDFHGIFLSNYIKFQLSIDDVIKYNSAIDAIMKKIEILGHKNEKKYGKYEIIDDKIYISYKRGRNITECLYFMAYCYYIKKLIEPSADISLVKTEKFINKTDTVPTVIINNIDLFSILTYFKNCNKFVCVDFSCENVKIENLKLENILRNPGKEKRKLINKIKNMRSKAVESGLRGGKKEKKGMNGTKKINKRNKLKKKKTR